MNAANIFEINHFQNPQTVPALVTRCISLSRRGASIRQAVSDFVASHIEFSVGHVSLDRAEGFSLTKKCYVATASLRVECDGYEMPGMIISTEVFPRIGKFRIPTQLGSLSTKVIDFDDDGATPIVLSDLFTREYGDIGDAKNAHQALFVLETLGNVFAKAVVQEFDHQIEVMEKAGVLRLLDEQAMGIDACLRFPKIENMK